jgi:hypothetical protein
MLSEGSPNEQIDSALAALMKKVTKPSKDDPPVDIADAVKVVNTAINWEKVKHQINGSDDGFDPSEL